MRTTLALLLVLLPLAAVAQTTAVRTGDHPGFGRVVFDLPAGADAETRRDGDQLQVTLRGTGPIEAPGRTPRNVRAIEAAADGATIVLSPGARLRTMRLEGRIVIDVLDRAPPRRPGEPAAPAPAAAATPTRPVEAATPAPVPATPPAVPRAAVVAAPARPAAAAVVSAAPAGAPQHAPVPTPAGSSRPAAAVETPAPPYAAASPSPALAGPVKTPTRHDADAPPPVEPAPQPHAVPPPVADKAEPSAAPVPAHLPDETPVPPPVPAPALTPAPPGPAIGVPLLLRTDATTGAAAFRRGEMGIVVLDRRPVAPAPGLVPQGEGAVLKVPLPPDAGLRVQRAEGGWSVVVGPQVAAGTMRPAAAPGGLAFAMPRPGRVVTLADPLSGGTLLVGTSLEADAGAAQPDMRRTPGFALLPSWLGVTVEASSDEADLRATTSGFLLAGGTLPPAATTTLSRRFDLPPGDPADLLNRMRAQLAGAATALPRARPRERLAAATTMVALGLGSEAQALAQLAAADDPQLAADATSQGLIAAAALIAGRPAEAEALDDPRLDGTDEIELWRGLRDRRMAKDSPAARGLGTKAPLALEYPAPLGRLLLPDVAEAAVESGAPFPEAQLTPYARAMLLERRGKSDEALAAMDALAAGPDRLDQVRATARAAELRLAAGKITPAEAAAVMERQSFAWRGDVREADLRIRAAELRGQAGEWRGALTALRDVEAAFPERRTAVRVRMAQVLQAMLAAEGGSMSPLDVVLLAMEHADPVIAGEAGAGLSRLLAAKLTALDLPARAIPVLQALMRGAPPGEGRAALGARLAQMLLDGDEPAAAMAALDGSAADGLPAALGEGRAMLRAKAAAAQGDVAQAVRTLSGLDTAAADDLRATLLAKSGDWRGAASALADLAAKTVPGTGPLDTPAQDILMRLAAAAAQGGDAALLKQVAASADRVAPPRDSMIRVLTAAPIASVLDLPRAGRELKLARALPQQARELAGR